MVNSSGDTFATRNDSLECEHVKRKNVPIASLISAIKLYGDKLVVSVKY